MRTLVGCAGVAGSTDGRLRAMAEEEVGPAEFSSD